MTYTCWDIIQKLITWTMDMYSAVVCLKFKCSIDFDLLLLISKRTVGI